MTMLRQRLFDLVIAVPLLSLAIPLLALLMLLVRLDSPGRTVFTQMRIGRGGKTFALYKLRTFHQHAHGLLPGEVLSGDPRVTRIGKFLRATKLDELPQLVNVVLGDMSLVGPRPDIPIQVAGYDERYRRRLAVRPGLTGLAQISGNIQLSWPQRIELDLWYISHRSLWLDLVILVHTAPVIWRGERGSDDPLDLRQHILKGQDMTHVA